jgi:hypothetical protein
MIAANDLFDRSNWSYKTPNMARRLSNTISTPGPPQKKMRLLVLPSPKEQPNDAKIGVNLPLLPDFGVPTYKRPHLAPRTKLRTCRLQRTRSRNSSQLLSGSLGSTGKQDPIPHLPGLSGNYENSHEIAEKCARCAWYLRSKNNTAFA